MSSRLVWIALAAILFGACAPASTQTPDTRDTPQAAPPTPTSPTAQDLATAQATAEVGPTCDGTPTTAQTEGPYYKAGSPERTRLVEGSVSGTPLLVTGRVLDADCQPVAGAKVDFWQADAQGDYDNAGYGMRGHQLTDEDGGYRLETVVPGEYPGRTPHIHVKIFDPAGRELLTTQLYLPGLSELVPDSIFDPALLTSELPPESDGRRHVSFDFIVAR
ncbi:MAG TPA: hypothetical protein VJ123_04025 [Anaerolineales bacterium]|nr:hypothetical protein [Anaerolineales bacterium]